MSTLNVRMDSVVSSPGMRLDVSFLVFCSSLSSFLSSFFLSFFLSFGGRGKGGGGGGNSRFENENGDLGI